MKIVLKDSLSAKAFITNKDIGFVQENMAADEGRVVLAGSDSFPPPEAEPFYNFPAKVSLERQTLLMNGREVSLQSRLSVNVNIKV